MTYQFSIILKSDLSMFEIENALYEAGCDDAILCFSNSLVTVDFDREGKSLDKAVSSAIEDIKKCKIELKIIGILNRGY